MIIPKTGLIVFAISCLNWPEDFPYKPEIEVSASHDGEVLHLEYKVSEKTVRALQGTPGGFVFKDSCVEFFIQPDPDSPYYYNFEWNPIGVLYLARRTGRKDPEPAPKEVLALVKAEGSLGTVPFDEHPADGPWILKIDIPKSAFWHGEVKSFNGLHARANFYKCGDGLQTPHYVSWAPVGTPSPDYHRPEYFAPLDFE